MQLTRLVHIETPIREPRARTLQVLPNAQRELQPLQLHSLIHLFSLVIPDLIIVVEHHLIRRLAGLHIAWLSLHNTSGVPTIADCT